MFSQNLLISASSCNVVYYPLPLAPAWTLSPHPATLETPNPSERPFHNYGQGVKCVVIPHHSGESNANADALS